MRMAGHVYLNRPQSGFTLLELLLVLTLVSVLVLIVPPALTQSKAMQRTDLKKTVREMVSALRYTRSLAIREGHAADFKLKVSQNALWYPALQSGQWQVLSLAQMNFTAAKSHVLEDGVAAIRFFPDGSSSGGSIEVSRDGRAYTIAVSWLTGKVNLIEKPA